MLLFMADTKDAVSPIDRLRTAIGARLTVVSGEKRSSPADRTTVVDMAPSARDF